MANEDPPYSNWLRRRPCQACGGPGPCEVHHSTVGDTVAPGERRPSKSVGAKRGKSQRSHDAFGISLHTRCHANFHEVRGFFSGFTQTDLREWQEKRVEENRAAYELELAAKGEEPAAVGILRAPVPSSLDEFDIEGAAADFLSNYEGQTGPQVHHDLVRLLARAVKAGRDGRAA